ncbi:MAG: hypothetical protein QX197_00250 [Methylococcaceae bacterium]
MSLNNVVRTAIRRNARWLLRLTALIAFLLHGCGNDLIPLEEAKNKHYAIRVENVDFDLPLLYHPLEGSREKGWEPPSSKRETVDAIKIVALLPDMDFYNEKTANEFKKLGYGKKVRIFMTHYRVNWPYYFDGAYKRLIKLPEHPLVPGMFHYRDPMSDMKDIYMSHDQPIRDLARVRCDNPELDPEPAPFPACTVTTLYRDQFQLEYHFALEYLKQWRDIDRKVKALLDSFIPNNPPQ